MRVVVATDGSREADKAIELVRDASWPADTEVRVVTSVPPPEPLLATDWVLPAGLDEGSDSGEWRAFWTNILDVAVRNLERPGITVSRHLLLGRPASMVVEEAREFGADVIVVGSRGHGTIASMLLGSVSADIADHAHCPVLVARRPEIRRVVLGVDGSTFARTAEDLLATWPIFEGVNVAVASVVRWPSAAEMAMAAYVPPEAIQPGSTDGAAEHGRIAEDAARRLLAKGRDASARVLQGDAATELIRSAHDQDADLIVVGTHGRTGLRRAMFGSVARNVMLHAPCSVLLVRERRGEAALDVAGAAA